MSENQARHIIISPLIRALTRLTSRVNLFIILVLLVALSSTFYVNANPANAASVQIPLQTQFKNVDTNLRAKIAQKLFVDLRYYCAPKVEGYCQEPMRILPPELATMLEKSKVGGVILFSENLSSAKQIVNLTHQMQAAVFLPVVEHGVNAQNGHTAKLVVPGQSSNAEPTKEKPARVTPEHRYVPLYIGIDQEGGRVSRLPQEQFLGFAGNMAIGATYAKYNEQFAKATSEVIAKNLSSLGINVNFAPVLDVNSNPNNPIINVRAYSQSPKVVAKLGGASIQAMQQQGISVAAKHFPGHGDTFLDSHEGLPRVNHTRDTINKIDLFPFRAVIADKQTRPDMIMTAHIQYPALDDTPFVGDVEPSETSKLTTQNGEDESSIDTNEQTVLPATLSHKILTGILRDEYAYSGLIITDALDMKSITQHLSPTQAVIKSFSAGADITLMPYQISSPEDAVGFLDWLNQLTILIALDDELKALVDASYDRIVAHKEKRKIAQRAKMPLSEKLIILSNNAKKFDDNVLAMSLSKASFTQIKPLMKAVLPNQKILALMPDERRCQAFEHYWKAQVNQATNLKCISLLSEYVPLDAYRLANVEVIVVGDASPLLAFYESAKYEGINANQRIDPIKQQTEIEILLQQARQMGITTILVKLRSPYISVQDIEKYDGIFASYDYQVTERDNLGDLDKNRNLFSPAFASLVKVITGVQKAEGQLPVTLAPEVLAKLPSQKPSNEPAIDKQAPAVKPTPVAKPLTNPLIKPN